MLESLEDGALVIEVAIKMIDPRNPFIPVNPSACEVIQRMFMDERSADVVIEVGGRQFHAHRVILQQCSIILAELCESALDQTAPIQISDVSPDVFHHLLYYVYGGKVLDYVFECHAKEIINAADKYGVINLKLEAEVRFVEATTFTMDNVMDNLLYAESKNCALLKESVMDFIAENKIEALKQIFFEDAPGNFISDILAAVAREDRKSTTDGDSEGELITMRISELRQKAHSKRLNVDGSREMLIATLSKKQKTNSLSADVV
jgi:speckle-type POZ protein